MKSPTSGCRPGRRVLHAFTLTEVLTSMSVFGLVVVCVISSHLMGLKMFNISATKLSASNGARSALNRLRDDIRLGKLLDVGIRTGTNFDSLKNTGAQRGNAIKICPTTDTNKFILYYLDESRGRLMRSVSNQTQTVSTYITNKIIFSAEDYLGNVLTNDLNCHVVKMVLEFYQWEFPTASAGAGGYYDYYRLQTRISRRSIE